MTSDDTASLHSNRPKKRFFHTKSFRLLSMFSLTFGYFIVELVVGNITNSVALVADAFHMLSDVISLVIALVAVRISKRRTDINTYGWVRAEVVGANINTVFLLALCLTIVFDAVKRFFQPEPIENVNLLLIVGSIGLGINIIGLFLFQGFHGHSHGGSAHGHSHGGHSDKKTPVESPHGHGHSHDEGHAHGHSHDDGNAHGHSHANGSHGHSHHHEESRTTESNDPIGNNNFERHSTRALQEVIAECSHQTHENSETVVELDADDNDSKKKKSKKAASMNMHGVFLHVLADALGSVVVIISALIIKFVPHDPENKKHWTVYIDPILSLIIVVIISMSAIRLFKDTTYILLQTIPKHMEIKKIKSDLLETIPEVYGIHELHIWRLTNEKIIASAHLNRLNLINYMAVADKVKKFFHSLGIHSVTIQYECDYDTLTTSKPRALTATQNGSTNEEKIVGDCLLRCENAECDTQTCCTKSSDRTNILVSDTDPDAVPVFSITQPNNNVQTQTSVDGSAREVKL